MMTIFAIFWRFPLKSFHRFICVFLVHSLYAFGAPTPETILKKADEVRNPGDSFRMKVQVETEGQDTALFSVATKGKDKTQIRTLKPKRDRGRNLLMLEENMWVYIPNLKRSVRISLNQKLSGQAANGDISRMRWAGDYKATVESENKKQWVLLLEATKKGLTYEKIRATIQKGNFRPLSAEYLTKNGKMLKKATFKGYREIAGGVRPTVIEIQDVTRTSDKSVIKILELKEAKLKDSLFHQNNLK